MTDETTTFNDAIATPIVGPTTQATTPQAGITLVQEATPVDAPVLAHDDDVPDVDPMAWLSGSLDTPESTTGYYYLPNNAGRIKLAALTEKEENAIRSSSTRINPKNPGGPRVLQTNHYKRNLVAAAMNKAVDGNILGAVNGDALASRLSGQVTEMFKVVIKLGGFNEDSESSAVDETQDLFS